MVPLRRISTQPQVQPRPRTHVPLRNAVKVFLHVQMGHPHCVTAHMSPVQAMPLVKMAGTVVTVPPFSGEQVTRRPTTVRLTIKTN
jgi:hypothetical protein